MPYYTQNFQGAPNTTARTTHVISELDAVETGFGDVEADVGRAVRFDSGSLAAMTQNASQRANKFLKFDATGGPTVTAAGLTWRGAWLTATQYLVGDIVTNVPQNSLYVCLVAHSSGTFATDLAALRWEYLINLTSLDLAAFELKTTSFIATVGGDYMVDSSGGDIIMTMPAAPNQGDAPINFVHVGGSLTGAQTIRIVGDGTDDVMGAVPPDGLAVNVANSSFGLAWYAAGTSWRLVRCV